jgi:hypothetical protein
MEVNKIYKNVMLDILWLYLCTCMGVFKPEKDLHNVQPLREHYM